MNKEQLERLGDFEINKLIAEKLFRATACRSRGKICVDDGTPTGSYVDYCGSLSDMMPLVFKNKINLNYFEDDDGWYCSATSGEYGYESHENECDNKNPLRAAAITYLLMHGE